MSKKTPYDKKYTRKLANSAASLSSLYMLPLVAHSDIVHITSPLSIVGPFNSASSTFNVDWDVDGNSSADFSLNAHTTFIYSGYSSGSYSGGGRGPTSTTYSHVSLRSKGPNNKVVREFDTTNLGVVQFSRGIINLNSGEKIGSTLGPFLEFAQPSGDLASSYNGQRIRRTFSSEGPNFIGFQFSDENDQILYGWAEISFSYNELSLTIDQWAYENTGSSINVGQVSAVPLPPSFLTMLGGLALGAGGVLRSRKLRKESTNA